MYEDILRWGSIEKEGGRFRHAAIVDDSIFHDFLMNYAIENVHV